MIWVMSTICVKNLFLNQIWGCKGSMCFALIENYIYAFISMLSVFLGVGGCFETPHTQSQPKGTLPL